MRDEAPASVDVLMVVLNRAKRCFECAFAFAGAGGGGGPGRVASALRYFINLFIYSIFDYGCIVISYSTWRAVVI